MLHVLNVMFIYLIIRLFGARKHLVKVEIKVIYFFIEWKGFKKNNYIKVLVLAWLSRHKIVEIIFLLVKISQNCSLAGPMNDIWGRVEDVDDIVVCGIQYYP
jgi:hypothetical protein